MMFLRGSDPRKALFAIGISIVLVCVVLVSGTALLRRGILKTVLQSVERSTGMVVGVEDLAWNSFQEVSLFGVEAHVEGCFHASVPTVHLNYRILFGDLAIDVQKLRVEDPVVRVRQDMRDQRAALVKERWKIDNSGVSGLHVKVLWNRCRMIVSSGVMMGQDDSGREAFRSKLSGEFSVLQLLHPRGHGKLFEELVIPEAFQR